MLSGLPAWLLALCLLAGVALDAWWGEPRRWHPLVGFGWLAQRLEARLNQGGARPIARALAAGRLDEARQRTGWIVSRDTAHASPDELAKATVESLLENGNDAVFGALFCFMLAGGPGVLAFRLANTLDAMWGYRSPRFNLFGRCAARLDDVFNYLPARLTALSYALLGERQRAWRSWRSQAPAWPSPNAGPVMAAGAGALGLSLGGAARYDGIDEIRPPLGEGRPAAPADIERAWRLVRGSCLLWLALAVLAAASWEWACR